jgi:predicted SAM-dependent methyltransferase
VSFRQFVADKTKYALTALVVPIERSRAAHLAHTPHLRLHLGCARNRLPHWVNIDLLRPGRSLDLYWDFRRGLPFPSNSVEAIFAEHLFEHLTYAQGIELMRECWRVLLPEGVLRIGVPDLGRYVASYLGEDDLIERVRPGRPTRAIALGEPFFWYGHQCMYDFETLDTACKTAGFAAVERSAFEEGRIVPNPDTRSRRDETLYVDVLK